MTGFTYLMLQLGLCLLGALLLGALLGFLLWNWFRGRQWAAESETWSDKLRVARDEMTTVRGELSQSRNRNAQLVGDIDGLNTQLTDWQTRFTSKEEELEGVVGQWQTKYDDLDASLKSTRSDLEARIDEANQLAASRADEMTKLSADLAEAKKFETKATELQGSVAGLTAELADLRPWKAKAEGFEAELADLRPWKAKAEGLEAELADLRPWKVKAEGFEAELADLRPWKVKAEGFEAELADLRPWKAKAAELEADLQQRQNVVARLQQAGSQSEEQVAKLQARIQELEDEARKEDREDAERIAQFGKTLEEKNGAIEELELRIQQLEGEAPRYQKEIDEQKSRYVTLEGELEDARQYRSRVVELERELAQMVQFRSRVGELEKELARVPAGPSEDDIRAWRLKLERQTGETRQARRRVNEQSATIGRLEAQLKALRNKARVEAATASNKSDAELRKLKSDLGAANRVISTRERRISELEAQLAAAKKRPTSKPASRRANTVRATAAKPARVTRKVAKKKTTRRRQKDDLKKIYGIGPKLERVLNNNGVHYFRQVAKWKPRDIQKFGNIIGEKGWFPGRIERDRWLKGASDQHFKKYGKKIDR